jgi:hypothetical protein
VQQHGDVIDGKLPHSQRVRKHNGKAGIRSKNRY